jgi:hypothetical protein
MAVADRSIGRDVMHYRRCGYMAGKGVTWRGGGGAVPASRGDEAVVVFCPILPNHYRKVVCLFVTRCVVAVLRLLFQQQQRPPVVVLSGGGGDSTSDTTS